MKRRVFVSSSVYALAHQIGMQAAVDDVMRQLDAPGKDSLPFVRTLVKLRNLDVELALHVDGGATYIGMARSRAFHEAMKSGLPWISLDDDIEVTTDAAAAVVDAITSDESVARVVLVPYYTRDAASPALTVTLPIVRHERECNGARFVTLPAGQGGGFGMVGINRLAMQRIHDHADPELTWFDYGERKLALFYEKVEDGFWYGEDNSFFKFRVPSSVTVEALLTGTVVHGGVPLKLSTL